MASGLALTAALSVPAAEAANIGIVRDAETEALLNDYLAPIVKVAKVTRPRVLIVPSQAFNAFVTSDNDMFVNVGTIIKSETPNELIGVLAHETGHLANRDVAFMTQQLRDTQIAMLLGALLGVGVAAAGAATGSSGLGQAGSAIFTTTATIGERSFLHFARDQEAAADRMAVKYLDATHQSSAGMLAVMQRLANEDLFLTKNVDPYLQDHPLPQARVVAIQSLMAKSKYTDATDPPALKLRHDLVRAKLVGFTWGPIQVNRRYPISDNSLPARYARAIVAYRTGKPGPALKQIDDLIASAPDDPYFYELKGQALLETGHPAEAIAPLAQGGGAGAARHAHQDSARPGAGRQGRQRKRPGSGQAARPRHAGRGGHQQRLPGARPRLRPDRQRADGPTGHRPAAVRRRRLRRRPDSGHARSS